jgi:hypothetical protein
VRQSSRGIARFFPANTMKSAALDLFSSPHLFFSISGT